MFLIIKLKLSMIIYIYTLVMDTFEVRPLIREKKEDKYNLLLKKTLLFQLPTRMAYIGRSGSGKSLSMIHLLLFYKKYLKLDDDCIELICPTIQLGNNAEIYSYLRIPEENIHLQYNEDTLQSIIEKRKDSQSPFFLILDDVVCSTTNSNKLNDIVFKSRHYNCSIMILSQKFCKISTSLRNNMEQFVIYNFCDNLNEKNTICNELFSDLSKSQFNKLTKYVYEKPYTFLCIDNSSSAKYKYRYNYNFGLKLE
jgi:hypothetical protein